MNEIWSFLTRTRWPRNALEAHNSESWNEVFSDLQEYGAHPSKNSEILCTSVHNKQITMYNRTEWIEYYVHPYRRRMNPRNMQNGKVDHSHIGNPTIEDSEYL